MGRIKAAKTKQVEVDLDTMECDGAFCQPRNVVDLEPTDHRVPSGWSHLISHDTSGSILSRYLCGICASAAVRK